MAYTRPKGGAPYQNEGRAHQHLRDPRKPYQNEGRPIRGSGSAVKPPAAPAAPVLTDDQQGAFDIMMSVLQSYGLGSLSGVLKDLILDGTTEQSQITLALQDTNEWRQRFAGNEMLRQAGLAVLPIAEYLSVEQSIAQAMKNYGLPEGFYDDPSDFAKWIGNSVAPNELNQRLQMYSDLAKREDPAVIAQLQSMGLTEGDILAHMIDPKRALPLLQQKYQQATLGGAARRAGVVANNDYLAKLGGMGITEQQAAQGYGIIGEGLGTMEQLGQISGESFTQSDFEGEVFEQNAAATQKRKRLASQERARFSGSSGIGQGSLTQGSGGQY